MTWGEAMCAALVRAKHFKCKYYVWAYISSRDSEIRWVYSVTPAQTTFKRHKEYRDEELGYV